MKGRIRDQDIEELRNKASIVDVASEYMQVKKAGSGRFKALCPFHQEKTPSFSIDVGKNLWHCLAGETGVVTWEGTVPIEKLAGRSHRLLTTGGVWVDAEIQSFGVQRLWEIKLSRNGVKKVIHATDGHRWFIRRGAALTNVVERVTTDLRPGDSLAWSFGRTGGLLKTGPAPFGIAHGFTFGDGARTPHGCMATFDGDKDQELLKFFPEAPVWTKSRIRVGRLPLFFKDRPSLSEAPAYLYGWLAGLFAADGCVSTDGQVILSSASRDLLDFVRTVANRLAIGTYGVKQQLRLGLGKVPSNLFQVTFINSSLHPSFFVLSKHRARFEEASTRTRVERRGWVVDSVNPSDREEEVYCAVVPGTHAFTLEDNILTGNCFGCGKGGDVIALVQELENLTFVETLERLAGKVGMQLTYEELSPAQRGAATKKMRLIAAHREAVAFFHEQLMASPDGKAAREYLKKRGLSKETVEAFQLGWAPDKWEELSRYLLRKRFSDAELIEADLARKSDRGGIIDRFRGRIMFPTFDITGEPVAFGGRVLDETKTPKYLNTAETPIFSKGRMMYGLNWAKKSLATTGIAIVVEGYMDVIALHQGGVTEAIATNGTALSADHFRLLGRFAPRAVVSFDSDKAGAAAVERAFDAALGSGLDVRVLIVPEGKDPADFVAAKGGDTFRAAASVAVPMVEYRLRREIDRFDLSDPDGRARAVRAGIPILARIRDEVLRRDYTGRLADWTKEDPNVVFLAAGRALGDSSAQSAPTSVKRASAQVRLERDLLKVALQYPDAIDEYVDGIGIELFSIPAHREVWTKVLAGEETAAIVDRWNDERTRDAVRELALEQVECDLDTEGLPPDAYVRDIVARMKDFALRRMIDEKKRYLQKLNPLENETEYRERYAELISLEGERQRVGVMADAGAAE